MGERVLLVVPEAAAVSAAATVGQRALSAVGLRLGVLDNSKGNADHLLRFIAEAIRNALPVASLVSLRKGSVSLPATADMLARLAAEADFVVSAMAD